MASKRRAQKNQKTKSKDFNTLVLSDVLCPVCMSILIEPVTLPCRHAFCFNCFQGIVNNTNLICPLCRIRMTSWFRKTEKACKLLDEELWEAIKVKFPQQVANKLCGVDDIVEEEKMIVVARPGEIRKEYERQKQKEDEEMRKLKEAEVKASEELIQKLKEEDDYEKAVVEEKLKIDERIAKKLAEEITFHTSRENATKKQGLLDRFIVKDNETITSQNQESKKKPINNFFTKEYTCRILCLGDDKKSEAHKKVFSPIIKKKIQQIQKIVEMDVSDSSDCFESEMRYFKPIDHKFPSQRKSPIKIPPKKAHEKTDVKILSPSGTVNFQSNLFESAFKRISPILPCITNEEKLKLKRLHSDEYSSTPNKKMALNDHYRQPPVPNKSTKSSKTKKQLFGKFFNEDSSSPPFYGFERVKGCAKSKVGENMFEGDLKQTKTNGTLNDIEKEDLQRRLVQEKADLEYAMKLQEEFDKSIYTRRTRRTVASKKQTTLDNMICCRVK